MSKNSNYIKYWHGKYNLGDIFSEFLFDSIYDKVLLNKIPDRKTLMFIGSEIPSWTDNSRLVCGLGWRQKTALMKCQNARPENFLYVRGKISRQCVIDSGIDIPYDLPIGDSGLLASLLYKPHTTKKHDIGIITHWSAAPKLQQYFKLAKNKFPEKNIAIMQMGDQTKTVLDLFEFICSCKVVVASSLHAIIFSHSFRVPALFFSDVDGYKFQDYYSAYDRINYAELQGKVSLEMALSHITDDQFICAVNPTSEEVRDIQKTILSALPYKNCFSSNGKKIYQDIVGKEPFDNTSLLPQAKNLHVWCSSAVNIQVLVQMLKAFNISHGIISPGTTHAAFSASILNDPFFKCYSVIDERSASYMAVGMSIELDEPVFVACTGATASRNYIPGATEAYYSNAKVLYITADYGGEKGMNVPQQVDRSIIQKDIAKKSYVIDGDLQTCRRRISEGLNYMFKDEGGPVHFNLISNNRKEFTNNIIEVKPIRYYSQDSELPPIDLNKKLVLAVETHQRFSEKQVESINAFCRKYNCIYLENLNNMNPGIAYSIPYCTLVAHGKAKCLESDLMIYVGGPYSEYNICKIHTKQLWKVGKVQGKFIDPFKNLDSVFDMRFDQFLQKYNNVKCSDNTLFYDQVKSIHDNEYQVQCKKELPFSNLWVAKMFSNKIPNSSKIYLSGANTYRSWNYWKCNDTSKYFKNTGAFGIDGVISTIIGSSLVSNKLHFCFIGDSAFFYDMNSLGIHYIRNNLRICILNNGGCVEFGNPGHYCKKFQNEEWHKEIMMAQGHYGNKSKEFVKHFSEDLGFKYLSAQNKNEFMSVCDNFVGESDNPIVLECFVNDYDDMEALKLI